MTTVRAVEKDRWTIITDDAECAALMLGGKWREDRPTTVRRADGLWALVNEVFKTWREARANTGNRG